MTIIELSSLFVVNSDGIVIQPDCEAVGSLPVLWPSCSSNETFIHVCFNANLYMVVGGG